jgi:hypothetical protein
VVSVVATQPYLWVLGMVGFGLRGGILLLTLPIIVLPTQVEVRFMLGSNLGSTGLTPGFWMLVVAVGAIAAVLALGALYVVAAVEVSAFERATTASGTRDHLGWLALPPFTREVRRTLVRRVFVIEVATLAILAACAVPVVAAIGQATLDEILRPASTDSIYLRVLADVRDPLVIYLAALVVVELLSAAAVRELLVRGTGLRAPEPGTDARRANVGAFVAAAIRPLRSPLRTLLAAAVCWMVSLAAVGAAVWAVGITWQTVTAVFLSTVSLGDVSRDAVLLLVAVLLAGVFGLGLLVCGIASALRSAVWTTAGLR